MININIFEFLDDYEDNLGENNYENLSQVKVAVCVKGMDFFEDKTVELLEWLLLQYALGADSVTLYIYHLNDRTKKMLIEVQRSYDLKLVSKLDQMLFHYTF